MFSSSDRQLPPAVVVHSLEQARGVLALGLPATLLSAPGAGLWAGAGWWRALVARAAASHPATAMVDILDCADAPGAAMAALRLGQRCLVLDPACPAYRRIAGLAPRLLPAPPPALDLASRGAPGGLAGWLRAGA